jgi:TatD DNase family protein
MILFDFHHHNRENTYGIYNLEPKEIVTDKKFSVGIHPKDIDENWEENFEKIKEISLLPNCVAIGECGLDGLISVNENLQKKRSKFFGQTKSKNLLLYTVLNDFLKSFHFKK